MAEFSVFFVILFLFDIQNVLPYAVLGASIRNFSLGTIYNNDYVISKYMKPRATMSHCMENSGIEIEESISIPDFSFAGNKIPDDFTLPVYNVTQYGILVGDKYDCIPCLQKLIDEVGEKGGGRLYFPRGKYYFNIGQTCNYIKINYSNIILEGEVDSSGKCLSELINCGNLVKGDSYPWLSPFFITTGENLQKSNIFWGLQFKKRNNIVMQSNSMSDPGSNGDILQPSFATNIIKNSLKGTDLIYVEDSSQISGKYILLGQYNTDNNASLLKELLGISKFRKEWQAASRAGVEEAPSYQWLVEIKNIIDKHTIQLVRPHLFDCETRWAPVVYNVNMLENIIIRNLRFSSTWNGLFHHHGAKYFYSVKQAQEMDYGWNCLNMKRVAHGVVNNVEIKNYTNPIYCLDSRNVTFSNILIEGYDGHQGLKAYGHACDNLFYNITFTNHYADMIGGEGNMYGNVFSHIYYKNPCFKPAEYDFHGFSEGPMSPPAYNLFECVYGLTKIHLCGSIHMQPSCAKGNIWWNCVSEGEVFGDSPLHVSYQKSISWKKKLKILLFVKFNKTHYLKTIEDFEVKLMSGKQVYNMMNDTIVAGFNTTLDFSDNENPSFKLLNINSSVEPKSLYFNNK